MRLDTLFVSVLLGTAVCTPVAAQVSIGIGMPGVSIGINLPVYPELVRVPDYPVYYAPQVQGNFFFYDGLYWVYAEDRWYASLWYNGPWDMVATNMVPVYLWRVPVRYYRRPPQYFRGWSPDAPPRWGDHWGHDWQRQHSGWDQWNRASAPPPAPLPNYQRQYARDRYPVASEQRTVHQQSYHYQPREDVVRQRWYQQPSGQTAPAQRSAPAQQQHQGQQHQGQQQQQAAAEHGQPAAKHQPQPQAAEEGQPEHGNSRNEDKGDNRGKGKDK